jgi:hypothetical protein
MPTKGDYVLNGARREPPQLNYAGQPIREGEGYCGRPENIPQGCPPVLGEPIKIRPIDARGRDRLGLRPEERAKRQSEMMKERWERNRPEMLSKLIENARQANLKAGRRRRRLSLAE